MAANRHLGVAVGQTLCPVLWLLSGAQPATEKRGEGPALSFYSWMSGGWRKLLPDEGSSLGSGICALSPDSSLSGPERALCLCVWPIRQALVLRDLEFLLLTGAQRPKAGGRETSADGLPLPGDRASLSFWVKSGPKCPVFYLSLFFQVASIAFRMSLP